MRRLWLPVCLALAAVVARADGDPTRPPQASGDAPAVSRRGPVLGSILVSNDRRLAVVNGRTLREGDRVGGAVVSRIGWEGVVLRDEAGETLLSFAAGAKRPIRIQGEDR